MDLQSLLLLNSIPEIGPVRLRALLAAFGEPERALQASTAELAAVEGISDALALRILHWSGQRAAAQAEIDAARSESATILTLWDEPYPSLLRSLPDAPPVLYCMGDVDVLNHASIAVVGSRRATPYGQRVARDLAQDLAAVDIPTVSGLARGIDTFAHQAALAAEGPTIAVLGSGLLQIYPPENRKLAQAIASQGALVSEFPLNMKPQAGHFPRRNRIIAGISVGTVVVEASEVSGALITARLAAELGREVFAVPGPVSSKLSRGPHRLIRHGAKIVERTQDILEEIPIFKERLSLLCQPTVNSKAGLSQGVALSPAAESLLALVSHEPVDIDRLSEQSKLSSGEFSQVLLDLELKGAIYSLPGKRYART